MITSEKVQTVIDRFERAIKREGYHHKVHMGKGLPRIPEGKGLCGTVACHSGHYAMQIMIEEGLAWERDPEKGTIRLVLHPSSVLLEDQELSYRHGAQAMAQDLGFESKDALLDWARDNPEIWGGRHGAAMFDAHMGAFVPDHAWDAWHPGPDGDSRALEDYVGTLTLGDIRNWWCVVKRRLEAREEKT